MSYATPTNVKSLFRNMDNTTDPAVTDAEIQEFLDDASAIIDGKIGTLYTLPITEASNPESYKILRRLETFKAADIVDDILNSYGEADKKPEWGKKAIALLNDLVPPINSKSCKQCIPTMKLPDATYLGTSTQRNRIKVNATTGTQFQKGVDTW